jgi:hypothetical protein
MRQQTPSIEEPAEKVVQDIRRATRKHYSAEENPDRSGRPTRRGQHCRAVSPRGDRAETVLSLVEGLLPRGWQEAPGWRYSPGSPPDEVKRPQGHRGGSRRCGGAQPSMICSDRGIFKAACGQW